MNPYICKKCGKNPLVHESDRLNGVCEGCKLKKLQAKRRREYEQQKAAGTKWGAKPISDKEIAKRIERIARREESRRQKAEGRGRKAADVYAIAPVTLKVQARRARKIG